MGKIKTSTKLRNTKRVTELCGFNYGTPKNGYGGHFSVYQLELIIRSIEERDKQIEELITEVGMLRERLKAEGGK